MKTLVLENKQVVPVFNTLDAIKVAEGRVMRGKGKLQKKLVELEKEYQEDRQEILEVYFEVDEKGELKRDKQGKLITLEGKDEQDGLEKIQELLDEEVKIDVVTFDTKLKVLYEALDKDDFTTAKDKEINEMGFDTLMDVLEEVFENYKKEEEKA
ncbi:DUF1617 family protein [Marinilactibacillus psychrotolerans]|uniref:DUF1617 family protein n=1 Tax=Marinilactibacillus psychrotolerans TaxID=191770 RepID=A0A5R9C073_9LACT|nr:DUF1617 family protein [Marinilactibacillus psychrotolerans]TLQ06069.1 DUF1617 family protein [Marinilactibacillus psychrotolerans]